MECCYLLFKVSFWGHPAFGVGAGVCRGKVFQGLQGLGLESGGGEVFLGCDVLGLGVLGEVVT